MAIANDPVCGMLIDTDFSPLAVIHGPQTYYFCSMACRKAFEAEPARYTVGPAATPGESRPERHEPPRTTTGKFFTAPKFGAAGSGGAEYEPLPEAHDES